MLSRHDQLTNPHATPAGDDYRGDPESASHSLRFTATVVAGLLLMISAIPLVHETPIDAAPPPRSALAANEKSVANRPLVGVDPNTATWAEIALLPGLGESVGRRCIEFREARRAAGLPTVFARPEDLMQINGIGEKVLRRIRPFLRFESNRKSD